MKLDPDQIRETARAYAIECASANQPVSMAALARRLGKGSQWLAPGHSKVGDTARAIALQQFAEVGVRGSRGLNEAIARVAHLVIVTEEPIIEQPEEELPRTQANGKAKAKSQRIAGPCEFVPARPLADAAPSWSIPESVWPDYRELPRILATPGRRDMFAHLKANYGRAVAMRYAYVCGHPPAKGARKQYRDREVATHAVV